LKYIVIVCSTTGEGEPPDNAAKFVRRIKKKTLSSRHLQHLYFAVLGLGDSNYTNFCNCPKGILSRLQDLGATSFYEAGFGDDAVGLEEVVEPWIDQLFPSLRQLLNKENTMDVNSNINIGDKEMVTAPILPTTDVASADSGENKSSNEEKGSSNDEKEPCGSVEETCSGVKEPLSFVDEEKPNLRYSVAPLCESALKIPSSPPQFLEVVYLDGGGGGDCGQDDDAFEYPGSCTGVKPVTITSARQLTTELDVVKKSLQLELHVKDFEFDFQPGDSFGIVCENNKDEVDYLIERLQQTSEEADKPMTLQVLPNTTKKSATIPPHIRLPSTLRHILTKHVDFRCVPRKALLRMLVDYTEDEGEKRRLQELCSTQGTSDYSTFVRGNYVGLVQLLRTFVSCKPPAVRVLELLPQLLPREYSIASYHGKQHQRFRFVFNVIDLPEFGREKRFGLCTKWLDEVTSSMRNNNEELDEKIKTLSLHDVKVPMYFRRPTNFRFPDNPAQPLIMIGPGTGVAPFIGFLEKREALRAEQPDIELGRALLFFGCRYRSKDDLYARELEEFKTKGILTDLYVSYSREEPVDPDMRYVQHNILAHKQHVLELLFERNGAVFICGDAEGMGRDVTNTFVQLIEEYRGVGKVEAVKVLNGLRDTKQFLEDVWT